MSPPLGILLVSIPRTPSRHFTSPSLEIAFLLRQTEPIRVRLDIIQPSLVAIIQLRDSGIVFIIPDEARVLPRGVKGARGAQVGGVVGEMGVVELGPFAVHGFPGPAGACEVGVEVWC